MTQSDKLKHGEQEKGFRNLHGNFDLNVTAPELEEQPNVKWQLIEKHNSQFSELPGRMENHKDNDSVDPQQCEEHAHQTKNVEGCIDHLLILAQSAEIVAQSEDGVARMDTDQNKDLDNNLVGKMSQGYSSNITSDDQEYSRELLHSSPVDSPLSSQGCEFCNEVTRPCFTQILKQTGCEYLIMNQEKRGDNQCKHLHGKTIRLSKIKHQARCKSNKDLAAQKMISKPRNEQPQGRILRLSQMKHQARSKGNAIAKEGTEKHICRSLHCNIFKDNKEKGFASRLVEEGICQGDLSLSMVEGAPAHNISRGSSQSSVAAISDAQKEFMPVKRLRLTQLRREVRLGNLRFCITRAC
ncbi:PREDICTED: uncharacterized protein LOC109355920 [Lupinus angustifolius]|uniref:uncharacterized protein LOC109355920 n=1 Tax=Lupinus angustifolius TaxID=3871 RepID=UPI00092F1D02|nr:PREDICTED: uncharacterized protein LOC109355920 [Lupinus angustifolius]